MGDTELAAARFDPSRTHATSSWSWRLTHAGRPLRATSPSAGHGAAVFDIARRIFRIPHPPTRASFATTSCRLSSGRRLRWHWHRIRPHVTTCSTARTRHSTSHGIRRRTDLHAISSRPERHCVHAGGQICPCVSRWRRCSIWITSLPGTTSCGWFRAHPSLKGHCRCRRTV